MGGVLLLNQCGTILGTVDWQRAVTMMLTQDKNGVPQARLVKADPDPDKVVRSPSTTVRFPRIIRLTRWLYVPHYEDMQDLGGAGFATRHAILARDGRICIYCGMPGDTVDHIFPRSRGGRDSWENLAACCSPCNGRKADRTPDEAGMRTLWTPYRPDATGYTQRQVWREIEEHELEQLVPA